jgi:hypothetical protein
VVYGKGDKTLWQYGTQFEYLRDSRLKPVGGISGAGIHQLKLVAKGESAEAD